MQTKILISLASSLIAVVICAGACFADEVPKWAKDISARERVSAAKAKFSKLFKDGDGGYYANGGELGGMMTSFVYGDIYRRGVLTDRQRLLITLAVLTVNQTLEEFKAQVKAAVNAGVAPEEIQEAVYQCAPYIGFSKALAAADKMSEAFREKNVPQPGSMATVTEADRGEKGYITQKSIFPAGLDGMYQSSPDNRKHVAEYLASMCFGDFYTRGALDIKTREILTLCIISAQGGCDAQVRAHAHGNLNVGNGEDVMIEAITQCLPYIGFPRTLNALACVADAVKQ